MSVFNQKATNKGNGTGEGFEKAPPGNHPAVLVAIVDMGTQKNDYQGNETWQRRAYFVWELVTKKMSGTKDRNHLIGIDLTVSLNEKAKLRQWIEARVGKKMPADAEYDITKELGKPCLLNVVLNKNGYPKIDGMGAVPDGLAVPAAQNKPFLWALPAEITDTTEISLPEWVDGVWLYGEPISAHINRCRELTNPGADKESDEEAAGLKSDGTPAKTSDPIPW